MAESREEIKIIICDSCSSISSYENAARTVRSGEVSVFNLSLGLVRSYDVIYEPNFGGGIPVEVNNFPESVEALNQYIELELILNNLLADIILNNSSNLKGEASSNFLHNHVNSFAINGPFGGLCGPEADQQIATFIPDGVFTSACAGHDACYAGGEMSKSFCDEAFRIDLEKSAQLSAMLLQNTISRVLIERLLRGAGQIYYNFVLNYEAAYDAYCSSADNASLSFCETGFLNFQNTAGGGIDLGTSTGISVSPGLGFELTFQCTRTIITSSDGSTFINEICFLAPR